MSNGKDRKLFISSSALTPSTPMVEVEFQGDLTINTGKSNERTPFKNGTVTAQGEGGKTFSFQFADRIPVPTGQDLIWDHHNAGTSVYCEIHAGTGSIEFKGPFKVSISEGSAPVSGPTVWSAEFSEDGNVTFGTRT